MDIKKEYLLIGNLILYTNPETLYNVTGIIGIIKAEKDFKECLFTCP